MVRESERREAAEASPQVGQDAVAVPGDDDGEDDDEDDGDVDGDDDGGGGGDNDDDDGVGYHQNFTCSARNTTMEAFSVPTRDHCWLQVHPALSYLVILSSYHHIPIHVTRFLLLTWLHIHT